jgi:hypothetical protein
MVIKNFDGGRPGSGLVNQTLQPPLQEPATPLRHRLLPNPQLRCHLDIRGSVRTPKTILDRNASACVDFERRAHITLRLGQRQTSLRTAWTGPIGQAAQPRLGQPAADVVGRHHAHPEFICEPRVHHPRLGTRQHDPCPDRYSRPFSAPREQLITLGTDQHLTTRINGATH